MTLHLQTEKCLLHKTAKRSLLFCIDDDNNNLIFFFLVLYVSVRQTPLSRGKVLQIVVKLVDYFKQLIVWNPETLK